MLDDTSIDVVSLNLKDQVEFRVLLIYDSPQER